jgi:hypothetical protein
MSLRQAALIAVVTLLVTNLAVPIAEFVIWPSVDNLQPYLYPGAQIGFIFALSVGELVFVLWLAIWGCRIRAPGGPGHTAPWQRRPGR